tara:strand:+ start:135 stop:1289 length:1155 start_codon:yes stop_codon:yes gene_type:complete
MITIGTDFSGIGSPEQGLIKLGVEHKSMFACDVDKYAKQSYLANYDTEHFYDDITTRNHNEAPYVDLYVAGFPCQAFSMAGKRKGFEDTRGTLFFDLLQYLKAKKPKYFVLENVKGLLSHNKGRTFLTILDCLAKTVNGQYSFTNYEDGLNYYVYYKVLNTKDYGIPQNRERVFIVGFRDEKHSFKFPKKMPLELKLKDIVDDIVDHKYYLKEETVKKLEENTKKNKAKGTHTDNLIKVHCLQQRSAKRPSIKKNKNAGGTGHLIKQDGTSYCLDAANSQAIEWVADYRNDEGLRKKKNNIVPCLTSHGNSVGGVSVPYIKQQKIRRLTPKECFRLQGFPDSFVDKCREIGISDTQLYKQAGNSMTADVMAYLIKEILINEKSV